MRFSKAVVRYRVPILVITLLLMIPAVLGMIRTRVNYDMLDYLPATMDTVIGQEELLLVGLLLLMRGEQSQDITWLLLLLLALR
jgi:hypothetical protein